MYSCNIVVFGAIRNATLLHVFIFGPSTLTHRRLIEERQVDVHQLNVAPFVDEALFDVTTLLLEWTTREVTNFSSKLRAETVCSAGFVWPQPL